MATIGLVAVCLFVCFWTVSAAALADLELTL